jgi:hypothetical protein
LWLKISLWTGGVGWDRGRGEITTL